MAEADGEVHRHTVRVYYEDTDFSGAVYHARYLNFLERGRTEFLRGLGVHHRELAGEGLAFAVTRMDIDFVAAARIDDLLTVRTQVQGVSGARLRLVQTIDRDGEPVINAEVVVAAVRTAGGAARLPRDLVQRLRG